MKKWLALILSLAVVLTLFAGCREDIPDPTQPPRQTEKVPYEAQTDEQIYRDVKLRYLSNLAQSDPEVVALYQAAEVFEARTGAQVEFVWLGDMGVRPAGYLSGGEQADIFEATLAELASDCKNFALDLTELVRTSEYESRSHSVLRQQVLDQCGGFLGIVHRPVLYGMYYNLDAFDFSGVGHIPSSWEEYMATCSKLIAGGYVPFTMDVENSHLALELHMERSLGHARLTQLMQEGGWKQDETALELIRRIVEFVELGYMAKWTPATFPAGQNKLASSNVAMAAGSNRMCAQVERDTCMNINWGVFAYPGTGEGCGLFVDSEVLGVHKDTANAKAAFDFLLLLTTGEFDQLRADVSLGIPADPNNISPIAGADACLGSAQPRMPGLMQSADCETYSRIWSGWYKVADYFANALNQIAYRTPKQPQATQ